MKGYVIANVAVNDDDGYVQYRSRTGAIVAQYGGRFLIRGGRVTPLEGDPGIHRLVVLEFPSPEAARAFYDSPEYQAIIPYRTASSTATFCLAEGAVEEA